MERSSHKYVLASAIAHALIFLSMSPMHGCVTGSKGAAMKMANGAQSGVKHVEHVTVDLITEEIKDKKTDEGKTKDKKPGLVTEPAKMVHENDDCKRWFGGIGITVTNLNALGVEILKVHHGYPAERAGLMAGDVIIHVSDREIRGEVGTEVTLTVLRSGAPIMFTMLRDKICY